MSLAVALERPFLRAAQGSDLAVRRHGCSQFVSS
jgi:hypothetical protein